MSCDIRVCSDNAVFGQPEVGLGITPRLRRHPASGPSGGHGHGQADGLLRSEHQGGTRPCASVLVNAVYPQAELMENAMKLANKIAKNAPSPCATARRPSTRASACPSRRPSRWRRSCSATASRPTTRRRAWPASSPGEAEAQGGFHQQLRLHKPRLSLSFN